jgi:hypothetical protein
MSNKCGKMRKKDNPYEIWKAGSWEWHVLKKYQTPKKEATNSYARWFCLVKTPFVPEGEMGDVYVSDVKDAAKAIQIFVDSSI